MSLTVGELRKILRGLPRGMTVVLGVDEDMEDICSTNVEVLTIEYEGENEREDVLYLPVCTCHLEEPEIGEINSRPELN